MRPVQRRRVLSARPRASSDQRSARSRGARAEAAIADFLEARGFDILGTNVRLGALEIDLFARSGSLAVVVEVRTRGPGAKVGPFESIDAKKRARLVRAAERLWRDRLSRMPGIERVRLDVAAVIFDGSTTRVEYVEGAFTA